MATSTMNFGPSKRFKISMAICAGFLLAAIMTQFFTRNYVWIPIGILSVFLFYPVVSALTPIVCIKDNKLVYGVLFVRHVIPIDSIKSISQRTFVSVSPAIQQNLHLEISGARSRDIATANWKTGTIGCFIAELKKINPNIQLPETFQKLIENSSNSNLFEVAKKEYVQRNSKVLRKPLLRLFVILVSVLALLIIILTVFNIK